MKLREIASLRKSGGAVASAGVVGCGVWGWLNHVYNILPWRSLENLRPLDDLKGLQKKMLLMQMKSKKASCGKGAGNDIKEV